MGLSRSILGSFVLLGALAVGGCAVAPVEESATSTAALEADQLGQDVTVLQAWIGKTIGRRYDNGYQLGDIAIDPSRCSGRDCTGPVSSILESSLLGRFEYDFNSSGQCETIEIRTVTRTSVLDAPTFQGLGFYLSGNERLVLVSKDALNFAAVGQVTLKDGSPAVVHRFVTKGLCFGLGGNGGSLYRRSYELKPFARFETNGDTYRVWDSVPTNYLLGRRDQGAWVQSFDRQNEVLF